MFDLQKYTVAISRNVVNHDGHGGAALDAMTWDRGGILKDYALHIGINIDLASFPGSQIFWTTFWVPNDSAFTPQYDVDAWPKPRNVHL